MDPIRSASFLMYQFLSRLAKSPMPHPRTHFVWSLLAARTDFWMSLRPVPCRSTSLKRNCTNTDHDALAGIGQSASILVSEEQEFTAHEFDLWKIRVYKRMGAWWLIIIREYNSLLVKQSKCRYKFVNYEMQLIHGYRFLWYCIHL